MKFTPRLFKFNKILTSVSNSVSNSVPILSGIELGIPINIISKVANDVNFLYSPVSKESILLNFLLGFSSYKQDRYLDAKEYFKNLEVLNNDNTTEFIIYNPKHYYYSNLINDDKNVKLIELSLFCSYLSICIFSIYYHIGVILPLFSSTFLYKYFKKNENISFLKPFYVASMWSICTCILPQIIYSAVYLNNYEYLLNYNIGYSTFFNLFALTNLADLKDYNEDIMNGVNTLPIILGQSKTKGIILISALLSTFLFIESDYYIHNFQNLFYTSCNLFPYINLFNFTF